MDSRLDVRALELIYLVFGTATVQRENSYLGRNEHWTTPGGAWIFSADEEDVIRFLEVLIYRTEYAAPAPQHPRFMTCACHPWQVP